MDTVKKVDTHNTQNTQNIQNIKNILGRTFCIQRRCLLLLAICIITVLLLSSCAVSSNLSAYSDHIEKSTLYGEPEPEKGYNWPYYLYIPDELKNGDLPIIVIANNSPEPDDMYSVHELQAKRKIVQYHHLADKTGLPLMLCAFPRFSAEWWVNIQALTRNALLTDMEELKRVDLQTLAMLEDAAESLQKQGVPAVNRGIFFGFSSSGSFAHRFSLLHPEKTHMVVVGAPGGWFTLPLEAYKDVPLRYQVGVGELDKLIGKSFNEAEYAEIPKFFFVGSEDTDNAVPYLDSFSYEDRVTINKLFNTQISQNFSDSITSNTRESSPLILRYELLINLFEKNGFPVTFTIYDGVSHTIAPQAWEEIVAFINTHSQ